MPAPTYATTLQAFQMVGILEGRATRAMPIAELAERLEVHPRTVKRYIDALADVFVDEDGVPRVRRVLRDGRAVAVLSRVGPDIGANIFQYAAVHVAAQHLDAINDPVLGDAADIVRERLREGLRGGDALVERVREAFVYVPFGPKDYGGNEDVVDAFVRGALRRHPVRIVYAAAGGNVYGTVVHPYAIVMYRDGLYVLGGEEQRRGRPTRIYAIDRVREAELDRARVFDLPPGFDPRRHFDGQLGIWNSGSGKRDRVAIAFDTTTAGLVAERRWPGFVEWRDDGDRRVLVLDVPVTPQVVTWVITWGAAAEVLEPASLRDQVASALAAALERYRGGPHPRT